MKHLICAVGAALTLAACGSPSSSAVNQSATGSVHPLGWGRPPATLPTLLASPQRIFTMYDSTTISEIPSSAFAAAGYTSGYWPTYLPLRARLPKAHVVSIAINASHHADCLDIEQGDAQPYQAPAWVRADMRAGFKRPCLYSSWWEFTHEVRPELLRAGILRSQVLEFDADYTGVPHIDASFDATQYTDHALGRNLDASLATASFLSIAKPAYVAPKRKPGRRICFTRRGRPSRGRPASCRAIVRRHHWYVVKRNHWHRVMRRTHNHGSKKYRHAAHWYAIRRGDAYRLWKKYA